MLLRCKDADTLVETLRSFAGYAEKQPPTIVKGEWWQVFVESYDGFVVIRFWGPEVGYPERVPMPADVARKFADWVEFKGQQARYKMQLKFA